MHATTKTLHWLNNLLYLSIRTTRSKFIYFTRYLSRTDSVNRQLYECEKRHYSELRISVASIIRKTLHLKYVTRLLHSRNVRLVSLSSTIALRERAVLHGVTWRVDKTETSRTSSRSTFQFHQLVTRPHTHAYKHARIYFGMWPYYADVTQNKNSVAWQPS